MVKPDISRDYYADLELKPGVDITEIKKAYKKLALKYHPDRNQGREAEFIPKFQAVNIANEILSDPAVKAKYDADRTKAGYRSGSYNPARPAMPQRNGWTPNAPASYYGPPPPAPAPRPQFNPTASAGANRFAKYTEAYQKGRQAKTAQETANSKTEAFKAWEKMKPSVPMNNRFEQRTPPPRAAESGYKTPPNRAATPNGFDQGYQRRYDEPFPDQPKTRRKGWAPDAPGDEPPAQNTSAYASIHRSNGRPQTGRSQTVPEQPPPRPTPTAKKPDPLSRFRAEAGIGEAERVSTPYASAGGERTYFNSATLNRSASTREGIHRAASNLHHTERHERSPPSAHRRHRSVSATRHRRQSVSSDSDRMAASPQDPFDPHRKESGRTPFSKSYRTTQEQTGSNGKSNDAYKNQQGKSTFATPYVESDTSEEEREQQFRQNYRTKRSEEKPQNARRQSRTYIDLTGDSAPENERSANRVSSSQQKKSGPTLETFTQKMANAELNDSAGRNQRPASATGFKPSGAPFEYARSPLSSSMKPGSGSPLPMGGSPRLFKWLTDPDLYMSVATANCKTDYSFAVPQPFASKPTAGADLRSKSTEEINAKFFSGEWTGKFGGNAANIFSRPQPPTTHARQRSPRRGQAHTRGRSQTRPTGPPQAPTPPTQDDILRANRPANPTQNAPNWKPAKFSPEDWAETIKQPLFHPPPPAPTSPVRAAPLSSKRSNSRLKTGKPPSTPARRGATSKATSLNATVGSDDEETSAYDRSGTKSAESSSSRSSGGGSAMDIDPPATVPTQQKDQPHGLPPRPVYVQHLGGTSGTPQTPQPSQKTTRRPSATMPPPPPRPQPAQPATAPLMPPRQAQPSTNKAQGPAPRPQPQHPVVDLTDLKECEPFTFANDGLQGMKAMASNLPYESKATSATTPLTPEQLRLPNPPRAPTAPSSITSESWTNYINRMVPYVREWHVFNDTMLKHFNARQAEVDGLTPKWLEVAGEPRQGGLLKYVKGLEEDTLVREHWNVACEKHHEAMKTFVRLRKVFLNMTQ